jgi:hypothetical protein
MFAVVRHVLLHKANKNQQKEQRDREEMEVSEKLKVYAAMLTKPRQEFESNTRLETGNITKRAKQPVR